MRVVVTRAVHQAEELAQPLRARGAEVLLLPMIALVPPADSAPLREAAAHCDSYDWIVFTSTNAVSAFVSQLTRPSHVCKARIAAVGEATARAAAQSGFDISLLPAEYVAEALVGAFNEQELRGRRILIPGAAVRRDVVPEALRERGAYVDVVEAYRNGIPPDSAERVPSVLCEPWPEWITFASPSAVGNLVSLAGVDPVAKSRIATIGPVTSDSVRKHGVRVDAEANPHTVAGLVDSIFKA